MKIDTPMGEAHIPDYFSNKYKDKTDVDLLEILLEQNKEYLDPILVQLLVDKGLLKKGETEKDLREKLIKMKEYKNDILKSCDPFNIEYIYMSKIDELRGKNKMLNIEICNLKKQLQELPKKIVCEIFEYCDKYYSHNELFDSIVWQENCPIRTVYTLKEFLDNLLKKYGGKDDTAG